jgi:hypothetical protein
MARGTHNREGLLTRYARKFIAWCEDHPLPATAVTFVGAIIAVITLAQGLDWVGGKLWPPRPRIVTHEEDGSGGTFSVTLENPSGTAMVVSKALFRAEPPHMDVGANMLELTIPAVTYDVPFDCAPGTKTVKLNPPFRVAAKDVGAVVFRSTVSMRPCRLYLALETSQGRTKEEEALSPSIWQTREP